MSLTVATIASGNYLAYVQVLRDSVARHEPEARFEVLIVDRPSPEIDAIVAQAGLHATYAQDLGIHDFEQVAFKFDVVELNTALKPTFLKRFFARGDERVAYMDPDIRLFGPLQPVHDALDGHEIVLTPHALAPVLDGRRPSDIDFLRTGTFNLGFVAVRKGRDSVAFLDWWEARCLGLGFSDFTFGVFVDQKWVDLAPSYFESVRVLRDPGCNVAYWNLHERQLEAADGGWTSNGRPLAFFHFSGVSPDAPHLLSRHQDRHVPVPGSPLAQLVAQYCADLLAAGHAARRRLPYGFGRLDDGTKITSLMRRASCAPGVDAVHPFEAGGPLQQRLRSQGLVARTKPSAGSSDNTLNFDPADRRIRTANRIVRTLARIMGTERVAQLVRYATFLGWGSNLATVLMGLPLDVRHRDPRTEPK